ncbi:MAG: hypothetical protein E7412_01115 [Ruminococcaceae bacterium]|nr:hypothetical protein [Oscillospiraceae bacterium]
MKKFKNKKIVGIVAAVLSVLWILSSLLRATIGTAANVSYGAMGFLGNLYSYIDGLCGIAEWLLVLIGTVALCANFFLKDKLDEKKLGTLKKLTPAVFGILAIKVFFDVLAIIDSFGKSMDGLMGILWTVLVLVDLFRAAAFAITSFSTVKAGNWEGKKKLLAFSPAVLMILHAAITFILRLILVFAPHQSFSVAGIITFITEVVSSIVLALTLGAIGFWSIISEEEEIKVIEEEE